MTSVEPYRAVLIILYAAERILLQQRSDDAQYMPGEWGYFGGGIETNETPLAAVIRETQEEISYQLYQPSILLEQWFLINGKPAYMYVFMEELRGNVASLRLYEGKNWGWFVRSELNHLGLLERDISIANVAFDAIDALNCNKKRV